MSTAQEIVDSALSLSAAVRADLLTLEEAEYLRVLNKLLARWFLFGTKRNATVFATSATVAYQSLVSPAGWPFPSALLSLLRVEGGAATTPVMAAGTEIAVTRLDDKKGMTPMAAVFPLGRTLVTAGNAGDPTAGDLTLYYAAAPTALAQIGDTLDSRWPTIFDPLLSYGVARHLAGKDARAEDLALFAAEIGEWTAYFDAWLLDQSVAPGDRFAGFRAQHVAPAEATDT
jgi:hypothetical protein